MVIVWDLAGFLCGAAAAAFAAAMMRRKKEKKGEMERGFAAIVNF